MLEKNNLNESSIEIKQINEMEHKESFEILYDLQKTHAEILPHIYRAYASVDELMAATGEDSFGESYCYILEYEKNLAGYAFLMKGVHKHPSIYVKKKYLILEAFILDSKYRGFGLSKVFLKYIKDKAKENGFERIDLEVLTNNNAINLYKSFDFNPTMLKMSCEL